MNTVHSSEAVKGFRLSEGSYINVRSTVSGCKKYSAQRQGTHTEKNVPV